jgi:type I restriction enzyme M protein
VTLFARPPAELCADYPKDYKIILFHREVVANWAAIAEFMAQYITKTFEYLENVVGMEINFTPFQVNS